jgi:transcriptional regulator with GAF, ATPase, and Fis domain
VPGGLRIRDEGSTNGVLLAGLRIYDAVVTAASHLQLGDSVIAIEPLTEVVDREQATQDRFGDLRGRSARMRELFADLGRIAPTDVTVLIEGETGTGKELVAESLHLHSPRATGPFVVFDCSAVTATLAESELFGHERGAFTGAVASRPGIFEQADGGTILLDELGELPKDLQPKLLRVLEKRQVRRLGSQKVVPIDVRVLAATNRNLAAEVGAGNFREDLYFRLAAAHVHVPPLRDRMEDLSLLVEHFLSRAIPGHGVHSVPPPVWEMFIAHRWPGNVRELINALQRMIVTPEHALRPPGGASSPPPTAVPELSQGTLQPLRIARREASDVFERRYLEIILERTDGNVSRAAAIAEVSRQMVQKLMRKHGVA